MNHGSNPWEMSVAGPLLGGTWEPTGWTHRARPGYPLLWAPTALTTAPLSAPVPLSTCCPPHSTFLTASGHLSQLPTQRLRRLGHLHRQQTPSFLCPHLPAPHHGATPAERRATVRTARRRRALARGARARGAEACTAATSRVVVKFTARPLT